MNRILTPYIVGDIHGCFAEYLDLERKIIEHASEHGFAPLFVSVGDVFDRGPRSSEVLEHFVAGIAAKTHVLVMGNHESEFLRVIEATRPDLLADLNLQLPATLTTLNDDFIAGRFGADIYDNFKEFHEMALLSWRSQGGHETIASYQLDPHSPKTWKFPQSHLKTLIELPLYWYDDGHVVTHALAESGDLQTLSAKSELSEALSHQESLNNARDALLSAAHSCLWNRRIPKTRLDSQRVHVSGHTPMDRVVSSPELAFLQIDTACVYGKTLTAYCTADKSLIRVKSSVSWSRESFS